jgi:hypothetical protein
MGKAPGSTTVIENLHGFAVLDQFQAFDDMKLCRVRRAVIVDEGLVGDPDGINDRVAAVVTADRFPVP